MTTLALSRKTQEWKIPERPEDNPEQGLPRVTPRVFAKALQASLTNSPVWQDAGASLAYISPEDLDLLKRLYLIREPAKVTSYLHKHPFLVSVLVNAYLNAQSFFPDSEIALQIVSDQEEEYQKLFAYILTEGPAFDSLTRLDKLDDEWFLDQPEHIRCTFNLNLEFV